MEQREFKTLNPSDSLPRFPPHRRRPLRSQTYDTLFRILSHCNAESHRSRTTQVVPDEPKQGNGLNELGKDTDQQLHDDLTGPATLVSENLLVEKAFEGSEVIDNRDGGFNQAPMKIDGSDGANRIEGNEELIDNDGIGFMKTLEEKKDGNVLESNNQEDQFYPLEVCMEKSGNAGQLEIDKEQHTCSVTEVLDSSPDIDRIAERLISQGNDQGNNPFVEKNEFEEVKHEIEHKNIELEKSLSTCTVINHPLSVASEEDIEEGEISGDIGICDQSSDWMLEGNVSSELKKVVEEPICKDIRNKEEFVSREQKDAYEKEKKSNSKLSGMEVEFIGSSRVDMDYKSEMVSPWQNMEAKQSNGATKSGRAIASPENLFLHCRILGENVTQNEGSMSYDKDDGVCKKRKRGPKSNERRRKKKLKERVKRAEKNRKLGIKRLKLQPVLKPLTVIYCRHYLRGRCQEGDKCKFSHDTIPLTKSVACSHFARHSCMKGDDCPFDHELSKYPCDKYVSKGSCHRGADCMFSHDMPQKEGGSPMASNVSKPGLKSSSLHGNSNSNSNSKNAEQNVAETSLTPAAQRTLGKNIVSFEKSSLGNTSQRSQPGSSVKEDNGVKVCPDKINSASDIVGNSNYITKKTAGVAPRGINFLSFGKAPLDDDLSSKDSSRFPANKDYSIGKSVFGGSSTDIQAGSSPKRNDGFKVDNQVGQSASNTVRYLNEMPKGSPSEACPRLNFLSYGKGPITDSSSDKQASSPSGQSLDQLADGHGKGNPSSMQKLLFSNTLNSSQKTLLSNAPSSAQKALLSTLAFAAKHESEIKMGRFNNGPAVSTNFNKETGSSQVKPMDASKILDFLYGGGNKRKQ